MSIKKYGSSILRSKAKPVTEFNGKLEQTVEEMKKTMAEANGVGLSANQVGLDEAIFIAKLGEEMYALVNPVLTPLSNEIQTMEEGCLSIPGVWVEVDRYLKVRLRAQNLKGETVELELEGYPARVVQHEVDHLNGVLIIDRIPPAERRRITAQLEEIKNKTS
jgi:peptide deformylase